MLEQLAPLPRPIRGLLVGAVVAGFFGGIVGLVIGLMSYPPTAVFAIFEAGIPAAVVGGSLGLIVGTCASIAHWIVHPRSATSGPSGSPAS